MTSEEQIKKARDRAYNSMTKAEWGTARRTIQGLIDVCEGCGDESVSLRLLKMIRQDLNEARP